MRRAHILLLFVLAFVSGSARAMTVKAALGMVETGADKEIRSKADQKRGRNREVTRFQILPNVFHQYTRSRDYANPEVAWAVAERILVERTRWFKARANRAPNDLDLYLLWNAPGLYERVDFNPRRMPQTSQDKAERFANLRKKAEGADRKALRS